MPIVLEVLVLLIQAYEAIHYPIPDPDPIDFLHHVMEARGLSRKDLELVTNCHHLGYNAPGPYP